MPGSGDRCARAQRKDRPARPRPRVVFGRVGAPGRDRPRPRRRRAAHARRVPRRDGNQPEVRARLARGPRTAGDRDPDRRRARARSTRSHVANARAGGVSDGVPAASAIVLAGGRSTRFGRDKLVEPVDGRPLLDHAIDAVSGVVRDVVVVGRHGTASVASAPDAEGGLRRVPDPDPYEGPLVALRTGLEHVAEPLALVVAGDMPTLAPAVLRALLRTLDAAEGTEAAALVYRGRRERLPIALRVGAATPAIGRLVGAGERRLGELLEVLLVREVREADWRALDPQAATLRD